MRAAGVPALTDDDYAVMKVARIGCECGANVSTFSCSSSFGQRVLVQWSAMLMSINRIRATLYSGGSQIGRTGAGSMRKVWCWRQSTQAVRPGYLNRLLALLNGGGCRK
ncbi:hypothetical protein ACNKHV_21170 [Shigella flexneri]